jgi:hypothetical protein
MIRKEKKNAGEDTILVSEKEDLQVLLCHLQIL